MVGGEQAVLGDSGGSYRAEGLAGSIISGTHSCLRTHMCAVMLCSSCTWQLSVMLGASLAAPRGGEIVAQGPREPGEAKAFVTSEKCLGIAVRLWLESWLD